MMLLQAAHWALVLILIGSELRPARCINPNIEVTWLLFGFLMGEIDSEPTACVVFAMFSATMYYFHRRSRATESVASATPAARDLGDLGDSVEEI